jgi:hypothetical protein
MPYQVAVGAKDTEALVSNRRVERVFFGLQKVVTFPEDTQFATYIQEPSEKEPRRLAVFLVMTPHPRKDKRAVARPNVVTMSAMPYEQFQEMEMQHRHYAGLSDPIRPIFAGVLRRHLKHYKTLKQNVEEMIT